VFRTWSDEVQGISMVNFSRVSLAFRAFVSIVFDGRIPDDVAAALAPEPAAAQTSEGEAQTPARGAGSGAAIAAAPRPDAAATQMLAVLQRDGRLIDFLMEDLAAYGDAQIGAAARDVHAGCRKALERYVSLAPVLDGEEGQSVTVPAGTDPARVKIIGNVAGQPPFRGVLRHRGWLVSRLDLPSLPSPKHLVVAPAEVELG
jgi:hypothetical protein